ncbi:hypothetical protein PENNAL_c0020G03071 [Penicillium nalgiovense]|uniref:NWD NACHT-NTPase N-terminal domain-containing protein n=1 Tax=Penicillium nalgiovense TaxID=60175 RepID=A0A1V6YID6_PENNA|nr:hypothetical protein PENNAL_c0020G03071 [Penicillium nalgiovense]
MSAYNDPSSRAGLWLTALDALDPHLKESLGEILKVQKGDVVSAILKEAERKKKLCLQKRWKAQIRGKTIVLRDLFDKIIAWVSQFSAVVDVAVQFDPGSASLPWAGVRFLLHVAVSDRHCFESTVHGLESVSLLIARYAAFEALYLQKGSAIQAELHRGLTDLYTRILTFLAHGIQYFGQPTAKRVVKSVFGKSQIEEIDQIAKLDEEIMKLAHIRDSQIQQETFIQVDKIRKILETLQSPICRLVDASMTYAKALEEKKFRAVIDWLSSVPYIHHQKRHSEDRLLNSAQWLFRHPQYIEWKGSSSSSIFLLYGIPGSGKTCLTSAVVDNFLREHTLNSLSAPVAYFYCGDSRFGRSWADPDEVMRSLTRQFAITDRERLKVHESITLEYARREAEAKLDGFEKPRLRATECADLILNILGANPAVIIVDGVDEVEEFRRHELLNELIRIRDESASVVKIFLSSRENSNVMAGLQDASMLRVQETDTRQDMEVFVEHCVSTAISARNLLDGNVSDDLRHKLTQFLLNRAGEMFLWVQLQLELLCKLRSASSVWEALNAVPKSSTTIDHLYSDILERLAQADSLTYNIAARAFSWLLCMREPLSSTAFVAAVSSITPDDHVLSLSELLSVCSNLIVVDHQLDTLRFAHVSFKEFLETKPEFDKPSANTVAALSCLKTCIYTLPIEIGSALLPNQDYHQYAVLYWAQHYTASAIDDGNKVIEELEEFILNDDGLAFQLWLEAANDASALLPTGNGLKKDINAIMSESQTPFFTACIYGLKSIFDTSVQSPAFNADMTNLQGHTGLYLAAAYGNHDLVDALLDLGADPGVSRGKWDDPLSAACASGHSLVATLLLNQETYSDATKIEPALRTCFLTGQEGLCKLLLKRYLQSACNESEVDRKNNNWLLEAAAQAGFSEVMEELVKVSSANSTNHLKKNSPKIVAAVIRKGQITFIKKLLEESSLPADIVATAALFGNIEIINLCLDNGYDIEKEGPFGTPLRSASLMGHDNAVRNLLSRGAAVNAVTPLGDALQAAAMKGHLSVTNILIQFHANVQNLGGFFGNALQAAAYRGHLDVAEALLSAGASIDAKGRYKDAFHAAAEGGEDGVIGYFLEKGYTFLPELPYNTARRSGGRGLWALSKDLLRCASPSFRGCSERPRQVFADQQPPEAFVSSFDDILSHNGGSLVSHNDMPEPIYEHRARQGRDNGMHCERDYYALEVATSRGHLGVVERLLANRERLGIGAFHLGQGLLAACTHGHITMVNSITSVEVDLRHYVCESLEIASCRGYGEIMEILIQYEGKWSLLSNDNPERASECNTSQKDHRLQFDGSIEFPHTLPLVLAGCRGGQLASIKRGVRLATHFEIQNIRELCLAEAARLGESDIVDFLLQSGVPFSSKSLEKAVHTAAEHGSKSSLALLVSRNGNRKDLGDCYAACLERAVLNGHVEVVGYLLAESAIPWSYEILQKEFLNSSREGCISIMISLAEKIQKHEADPLILTQALNTACAAGQKESAQWLIIAGADIDAMVYEKPKILARKRHLQSSHNKDHSHEKWPRTALQACLQSIPDSDHTQIRSLESVINLLLEHGADVNQTLDGKMTALHVAIQKFSVETVRTMIAKGADMNIDVLGIGTPLKLTAERELNALPILHALLESGAIVGSCDDAQQQWKSVLNASLGFFEPHPLSSLFPHGFNAGRFTESESVQDVLSIGPGAVIMHVVLSRPEIRTLDKRFSLLLQMLATSGDIDSIELLLDRGTDVNSCGNYYGCALQAAARFGHLKCVQFLLDANAEVNMINGAHGTPLQAAIIGNHQEIVTELIAHGADPNLYSEDSRESTAKTSPLQLSVQCNNTLLLKQLLNAGAKLEDGTAVLHLAVEAKDLEITKLLLLAGANIDSGDLRHSPPLITACFNGDMEMAKALLMRGANVNIRGTERLYLSDAVENRKVSGLHAACDRGYLEIAQILLNHGADVNIRAEDGKTPLGIAASKGLINIIELLLQSGAIIYDQLTDINVLRDAAKGGSPRRVIKPLVQALSNTPELGSACEGAIEFAARWGDKKLFLFLLEHVPKTSRMLNLACRLGSIEVAREILSYGVKIDSEMENGERALHTALYHLRVDLALFLIGEGADVRHVSTKFGAPLSAVFEGLLTCKTMSQGKFIFSWQWEDGFPSDLFPGNVLRGFGEPISDSESESEEEERSHRKTFGRSRITLAENRRHALCRNLIDILLQAGAEVNPPPTALGTPLEVASYMGDMPMIDVLVKHGANLNSVGGDYGSPLIASMKGKHQNVFLNLLDRGIDVNVPSKFGTALLYACQYGDLKKIQILLEHGADPNANGREGQSAMGSILSGDALQNGVERRVVLDVLLKYSQHLKITPSDVALALKLPSYSNKGILEMLYRHDKDLPVTQEVIARVVASTDGHNSTGSLEMLLGRAKDVEITAEILKSVRSPRILEILLQHGLHEITPDIFETLARHSVWGRGLVKVLLDQEPKALPTSDVVISVLNSFCEDSTDVMNTLQSLLDRNPSISVSETMITACKNADYLQILLSHDSQFRISSEFLETLTSEGWVDADRLKVMLEHDDKLRVSQASLNACSEEGLTDCVELILGNNPDLIIPQELPLGLTQRTEHPKDPSIKTMKEIRGSSKAFSLTRS